MTESRHSQLGEGHVEDHAEIAHLGHVTRARLAQIMNLRLLARTSGGRSSCCPVFPTGAILSPSGNSAPSLVSCSGKSRSKCDGVSDSGFRGLLTLGRTAETLPRLRRSVLPSPGGSLRSLLGASQGNQRRFRFSASALLRGMSLRDVDLRLQSFLHRTRVRARQNSFRHPTRFEGGVCSIQAVSALDAPAHWLLRCRIVTAR